MPTNDEELIETIEDEVIDAEPETVNDGDLRDAQIMTVPIDTTLTHSNEAAEAKAVGDALADKASTYDVQNTLSVNGRTADGLWNIPQNGADIPAQSDEDEESIADALTRLETDMKTNMTVNGRSGGGTLEIVNNGYDIPATSDDDEESVAEALIRISGNVSTVEGLLPFSKTVAFTQAGTQTVSDARITADHIIGHVQFIDSNDDETDIDLASIVWETGSGTCSVAFSNLRASGSARLTFVYAPEEAEGD